MERGGAVVTENGIDISALHAHIKEKGTVEGFNGFVKSGSEMLEADADILIPAAMELVITKENASRIKTPLIIEAANGPISAEGDAIIRDRGIVVIPDLYANAGGVTVSYFEWIKNLTRIRFGRLQRRQSENHFDAIISGVEMMTGKTFPGDLRDRAMTGATEIDLVRSGLEDTMRQAYGDISAEWNGNPSIPDLRTAAMKIAVQRVSSSYSSLGI